MSTAKQDPARAAEPSSLPGLPKELTRSLNERMGSSQYASTKVTLQRSGTLHIETYTKNRHRTEEMRCQVFVVCLDTEGRSVWVTKTNTCTMRSGRGDIFASSQGIETFRHTIPPAVAQVVSDIHIYHSTRGSSSVGDASQRRIKEVHAAARTAGDMEALARAAMSGLAI